MASELQFAAVGGGDVHVDHLNGGEFIEQAARGQARRQSLQTMADGDVEAIGEEGDEEVGLDALGLLVMDRPDGEIALEVSKRFLHLTELQIIIPQRRRIVLGQVAAEQIAPFAAADLSQFLAIESIVERGELGVDIDFDQTPSGRPFGFRLAELDQQLVARQIDGHSAQVFQARPKPLQLPAAHGALLGDPVEALREDIEFAVLRQQLDLHARPGFLPRLL